MATATPAFEIQIRPPQKEWREIRNGELGAFMARLRGPMTLHCANRLGRNEREALENKAHSFLGKFRNPLSLAIVYAEPILEGDSLLVAPTHSGELKFFA